ncbi:DNA internalization-related competence protein ComEC/Rec2 [Sarcina ventriculi]|uniref:ComEC/Rec2 family competence protein n=1 Tax=Sarcina ventriculi TaxID=1267 RepID=UPI000D940C0D|nr:hypothetical protein [Sarcina ventriculi]SPZ50684.1 DNA internalization-related competence protein ComEC/Rec2 [Sarcina ventriculi]
MRFNNSIKKEPLKHYIDLWDRILEFHIINVGQGLMILLIFPDQTTMLFDCYIKNDTEEKILEYLNKYILYRKNGQLEEEQWIDIFVNSHRDEDHYKGLKSINSRFTIKSIWDSGQYGTGASSNNEDYKYYMYLKREIKSKYGERSVPKIEPANDPFINIGGVNVYCLNSKEDFTNDDANNFYNFNILDNDEQKELSESYKLKKQHTNCIVLLLDYNGKKIILTGDSDWKSWKDYIVPKFKENNFLKSDILIASHHGSRSFFTDESNKEIDIYSNPETTYLESISYINPVITLISCGNYEQYHHPNKQALNIYRKNTCNDQVYTTKEMDASFVGFIKENGQIGVTTSNFYNYKSEPELNFDLICKAKKDEIEMEILNGDEVQMGSSLNFTAMNICKIADNPIKENIYVTWEVSNNGKYKDIEHQEIYTIGKKQENKIAYSATIQRDLVYNGLHMIRCTIENRDRNKKITKIFYIKSRV